MMEFNIEDEPRETRLSVRPSRIDTERKYSKTRLLVDERKNCMKCYYHAQAEL
jgi:hypothetical protein